MNPLLAMARVVNVCGPGQTPPSMLDVPEDARVLGHKLADKQGTRGCTAMRLGVRLMCWLLYVKFDSAEWFNQGQGQSIAVHRVVQGRGQGQSVAALLHEVLK